MRKAKKRRTALPRAALPRQEGSALRRKYPWATMDVGDVFHVSMDDATQGSMRTLASLSGLRYRRRFSVNMDRDNRVYNIRRVE